MKNQDTWDIAQKHGGLSIIVIDEIHLRKLFNKDEVEKNRLIYNIPMLCNTGKIVQQNAVYYLN